MIKTKFDSSRTSFWLRFGMLRGGRVTKVVGRDASCAPHQGVSVQSNGGVAAFLAGAFASVAKVSMLPLLLASGASVAYAQDACVAGANTSDWDCVDGGAAAATEQLLDGTGDAFSATVDLEADGIVRLRILTAFYYLQPDCAA